MKKLYKFLKLSQSDRHIFWRAYLLMMLVRLGMLLLPFKKLQNLILKANQLKFLARFSPSFTVKDIAIGVNRSARFSPGEVKCLAKALTTAVLMEIYSLPYQTKIGVAKGENNNLEAHAWVESEGKIVIGYLADMSRFIPMSSMGDSLIT